MSVIYIKMLSGEMISIDTTRLHTVLDIKRIIKNIKGYEIGRQRLIKMEEDTFIKLDNNTLIKDFTEYKTLCLFIEDIFLMPPSETIQILLNDLSSIGEKLSLYKDKDYVFILEDTNLKNKRQDYFNKIGTYHSYIPRIYIGVCDKNFTNNINIPSHSMITGTIVDINFTYNPPLIELINPEIYVRGEPYLVDMLTSSNFQKVFLFFDSIKEM